MLAALRWVIFLVRWMLFAAYGLLQFASKPGSRLIVPALAAAAAYLCRPPLNAAIQTHMLVVDWRRMPEPVTVEALAASGIALAICVYVVLAPRVSGQPSAPIGLLRFFARLAVLLAVAGGAAHYDGYRVPPDFMAVYAPWMNWQPTLADAVLLLALIAAAFVYAGASRLLASVLGAFRPIVRPLRPLRRLKVKNRSIRPVVVRVAVPKLPKPRRDATRENVHT
jgi:hypothetical protein